MGELLKNVRVMGAVVSLIGGAVAVGLYSPGAAGEAALGGVVAACGAGALAAFVAFVMKKRGGPPAPGASA